ncbi:MAG: hypothetical protein P8N40_11440 [Gammaproteobacteria bacterium]|nr:hypothetical protein [Gammaproteobacteria bacterium]
MSTLKITKSLVAIFLIVPATLKAACPDLSQYYALVEEEPRTAELALFSLTSDCTDNSEYFALLGSVQLSLGKIFESRENLELALLLDPQNGSALIDYAENLFELGQVTGALEVNQQILQRQDLPETLGDLVRDRDSRWRRYTRDSSFRFAALTGYDNNLNSAPFARQLALTLSGESILLAVSPEFRPVGGGYANLILGGGHRRVGSETTFAVSGEARGRFGDDERHNILQAATQLVISEAGDAPRWALQLDSGQLNYGGNPIFRSTTLRGSYRLTQIRNCGIYSRLAAQYQSYKAQRILGGIETSAGLGLDCTIGLSGADSRLGLEIAALNNKSSDSARLGGDRNGWQANLAWRKQVGAGQLLVQYSHTELNDDYGYSPLFRDGARRQEGLGSAYISYSQRLPALGAGVGFIANVYYHEQQNTIALFRARGASAEIGLSLGF